MTEKHAGLSTAASRAIQRGVWLMQPEYIELMEEVALRAPADAFDRLISERAVQGKPMTRREDCRAYVRDGIGVLPVTGPIYRYANFFTACFGGATVTDLGRAFSALVSDPDCHAIVLEIDSPGGEVNGLNEFAEMIYAARGKKPMVARVGGMACSAAYWIASAADQIAVDETAVLGSIGVYCAIPQEGGGKSKIFRSSNAPKKNLDPMKKEGADSIQQRIDAFESIFIAKVARNRDVTVERVVEGFGQGDVFVGEAAIEAGMADYLSSFEATMDALYEAHAPANPVSKSIAAAGETIAAVNDRPAEAAGDDGESEPAGVAADGEATPPRTSHESEGTMEEKDQITEAAAAAPTAEEVAALREQLAAAEAARVTAEADAKRLETEAAERELRDRMAARATHFTGDRAAKIGLMVKMAGAFGEDSEELAEYERDQNARAAQGDLAKIVEEAGTARNASNDGTAGGQRPAAEILDEKAKAVAAAKNISLGDAYSEVIAANPELYEQHRTGLQAASTGLYQTAPTAAAE
jgi:ClpP class serine protease